MGNFAAFLRRNTQQAVDDMVDTAEVCLEFLTC